MLQPDKVKHEMKALQGHFRMKRDYVIGRLQAMGFQFDYKPDSTFYIWLNLEHLPKSINDGLNFFQACLREKVCTNKVTNYGARALFYAWRRRLPYWRTLRTLLTTSCL